MAYEEYSDDVRALIASLKNPRYATADGNQVTGPIKFDGVLQGKNVFFVAAEHDPHQYGADAWYNAHAGMYGPIGPYVPPPPAQLVRLPVPPGAADTPINRIPEILERLAALEEKVGNGNGARRRKAVTNE